MEIKHFFVIFFFLHLSWGCVYFKGPNGLLQGRFVSIPASNKTFYAFTEMPYAQPPIGDLRFQAPKPVSNWEGVRDATKNTKICHQIGSKSILEDEDCLYLNVYTPQNPIVNKEKLPVLVYFHGGGFARGDGTYESYGPQHLMKYDVVIVTLNYRLGVYGFLSTQDEVIPGNNGLKDQLLALQWINQHISVFGGDPDKVTIFGQDAGAASVGYHLLNPNSKGLYRAAIMESGSPLSPWAFQRDAKTYALKLARNLTADVKTSEEVLALLKSAKVEDINQAAENIVKEETYDNAQLLQGYYFAPTIELASSDAFLTEKMYETLDGGTKVNKVPIIIGFNSEEALSTTTSSQSLKTLLAKFDEDLPALIPNDMNVLPNDIANTVGNIKTSYIQTEGNQLADEPASGLKFFSDSAYTRSIVAQADLQAEYSNVYFYKFDYKGQLGNIATNIEGAEKVGHGEEVEYLWRTSCELMETPDEDLQMRHFLLLMWTNFAKTMNPKSTDFNKDIDWITYNQDSKCSYLWIDSRSSVDIYPKATYFVWKQLYNIYGHRPFDTY